MEWKNLFRTIAILEALLLLITVLSYGRKLDIQQDTINKQINEISRLKEQGCGK